MTNYDRDKRLEELLDARAAHYGAAESPDARLHEEDDLGAVLDIADLLSEAAYAPPPLAEDPTAVMLGLVPDPSISLDRSALTRIRKASGMAVSDLARRLAARGWDVTTPHVFRWETQGAFGLSPALISAIADELGTTLDRIITRSSTVVKPAWISQVVGSSTFAELARRWAELRSLPEQLAFDGLEARMLATVHRGGRPEPDQLLETLEAFVSAMEHENGSEG